MNLWKRWPPASPNRTCKSSCCFADAIFTRLTSSSPLSLSSLLGRISLQRNSPPGATAAKSAYLVWITFAKFS